MEGIDKALYDRQLFVYGAETMVLLSKTNYLICGLGGLGVEVGEKPFHNHVCQENKMSRFSFCFVLFFLFFLFFFFFLFACFT